MSKFWKDKSLDQLNDKEWESLCDGCGKCCSHKFIDEETDDLYFTSITCELFDHEKCQCSDYKNRISRVSTCLKISVNTPEVFQWLPHTCAYSLIFKGLDLPSWHHLVSGNKDMVHQDGHSVRGKVIFEIDLDEDEEIEDFILTDQ